MFDKEESNKIKKVELGKTNFKRIGNLLITMTLLLSLTTTSKEETTICNNYEVEYHQRVYEYGREQKYDEDISRIYHEYQLNIDGVVSPLEYFYILYTRNVDGNFHLINVTSEYTDILTKGMDKYDYSNVVRLRDTTAFIALIGSDSVIIDDNNKTIIIVDKEKAMEIIQSWDGMIHDKVAETDAVKDKDLLRR